MMSTNGEVEDGGQWNRALSLFMRNQFSAVAAVLQVLGTVAPLQVEQLLEVVTDQMDLTPPEHIAVLFDMGRLLISQVLTHTHIHTHTRTHNLFSRFNSPLKFLLEFHEFLLFSAHFLTASEAACDIT